MEDAYIIAVLAASLAGNVLSAVMIQRLKGQAHEWQETSRYWYARCVALVNRPKEQERTDVRI